MPVCPRCGYANPDSANYCGGCGMCLERRAVGAYMEVRGPLREVAAKLKRLPEFKDAPGWMIEEAFWQALRKEVEKIVTAEIEKLSPEEREKLHARLKKEK